MVTPLTMPRMSVNWSCDEADVVLLGRLDLGQRDPCSANSMVNGVSLRERVTGRPAVVGLCALHDAAQSTTRSPGGEA